MKKINIKSILKLIGTLFKKIVCRLSISVFILIILAFIINSYLFNKFYLSIINTEMVFINDIISFDENAHNEALYRWEKNENSFFEAESKSYFDPFYPNFSMKRSGEKRLSIERTEELLSNPNIQDLLKAENLYEFYKNKGGSLLLIEDRAEIWEELLLGSDDGYFGTYNQNILFLEELKKELTD